ncbi:hypothetical protein NITHO_4710011 [Nitrolancea hollandica Lb]|uniref:Uncharacterized protein n=1 Tax=Nitrolancea hollandica Lb TaxID=1129897 RepID=I4EKP4_9BACT|nr:hypothetical protein NITHO_4710011 [Nitrolancea hollandica Lb]
MAGDAFPRTGHDPAWGFEPARLPLTTFPFVILSETKDLVLKRFFASAQNDEKFCPTSWEK